VLLVTAMAAVACAPAFATHAAGRLSRLVPAFVSGRARFVAAALELRGLSPSDALTRATLLNSTYAGLQADHLTTGEARAAQAELCALADSWTS
jgi:hypothetical protein